MKNANDSGTLQVTTPSEREIAMTRVFDAPRRLVYDAWTKPELLKRWLGVFGGWALAVCGSDLKVGRPLPLRVAWSGRRRDGDARRLSRDRTCRADRMHRGVRRTLVRR